jgi:predicted phage-related endonuclease
MSTEIEKGVIDFDESIAMWLEQYRSALAKIKEWEEVADVARSHIEAALGDAEVGLYKGQQVVRFTTVTSTRFDVKRAKELLPPQVLDVLQVQTNSRRFTLVNQDQQ